MSRVNVTSPLDLRFSAAGTTWGRRRSALALFLRLAHSLAVSPAIGVISALLDQAVGDRVAPAAQASVIAAGALVHESAHGTLPDGTPVGPACRFDVASITKLVTTVLAAVLVERRTLDLDEPVHRYLPPFAGKGSVTPRQLLAHTSGLPAWLPLFERCLLDPLASTLFPPTALDPGRRPAAVERSRELMVASVLACPLSGQPGHRVYSDLGFMVLGLLLEAVGGARLAELSRRWVLTPLGLSRTDFVDLSAPDLEALLAAERWAPTGDTRPREPAPGQKVSFTLPPQPPVHAPGQVDDDNAYALGGIAGHAGLFSTATDLASLGERIREELGGAGRIGAGRALASFARPSPAPSGDPRGLGFDLPAPSGSAVGERFGKAGPRGALGHLGFTGCSLWIDLDRGISAALVTNRVFFGRREAEGIRRLRREFHETLVGQLG